MGSPFLPLNKADLADNEDDNEDENHLCVHLGMTGVLLVHPQMLIVPLLFRGELLPVDAVPVYCNVLMVTMAMAVAQSCHLSERKLSQIIFLSLEVECMQEII